MDVGHHRDADPGLPDGKDGVGRPEAGDRDPHNVAAPALQLADLRHGGRRVGRVGVGHGLYGNRRLPTDAAGPDRNFFGLAANAVVIHSAITSLIVMITASPSNSARPTKLMIPSTSGFRGLRRTASTR